MGKLIPGKQGMMLSPDHPKGLGGWLVLVQIGLYLTLSSTVLTIFQFFTSTFGSENVLIVDAVLLSNIPSSDEWVSGNRVEDIARTLLTCLIWITYVLRSKRVRNTFVE
ncbi:hypothetical protein D3C85_1639780 [compost metagenome]